MSWTRGASNSGGAPTPPEPIPHLPTSRQMTVHSSAHSTEISHRGHRGRRGNPLAVLRGLCDPCESQFSTAAYECTVEPENWYEVFGCGYGMTGARPRSSRSPQLSLRRSVAKKVWPGKRTSRTGLGARLTVI